MTSKTPHSMPRSESPPSFTAFGLRAEAEPLPAGLHVVATPIGNLADISLRALGTLAAADAVIAEDTRVTKILLAHYGIATPLIAYHEHNAELVRPGLIARLVEGAALALVSDAGTPLISDPGYRLVTEAVSRGVPVTAVPGASAVLSALVVAGLPTDRFFFEGFLPVKSAARRQRIAELAAIPGTLVFFESPRRVAETLADLAAVLGPREAALARELTKVFETVRRGTLPELAQVYADEALKGEIVLLVGPPSPEIKSIDAAELDARIGKALETLSVKEAATVVSAETGQPRRKIYARAVELAARAR
ncbi:MAG TPA: 16S rRNA (cytidine(1402)-2'-O)-methyltransferase [Methylovirgula sp.]|nr:16S rRNA (cytidine(1402)-2'-O)-methyltransferase [Methylovirgula sp.]